MFLAPHPSSLAARAALPTDHQCLPTPPPDDLDLRQMPKEIHLSPGLPPSTTGIPRILESSPGGEERWVSVHTEGEEAGPRTDLSDQILISSTPIAAPQGVRSPSVNLSTPPNDGIADFLARHGSPTRRYLGRRHSALGLIPVRESPGPLSHLGALVASTTRFNAEFSVVRQLGRGGCGFVFHVINRLDEQEYAVKQIRLNPKRATSPQWQERVVREVRTLASLQHVSIVRFHHAWVEWGEVEIAVPDSASTPTKYDLDCEMCAAMMGKAPLTVEPPGPAPDKVVVGWSFDGGSSDGSDVGVAHMLHRQEDVDSSDDEIVYKAPVRPSPPPNDGPLFDDVVVVIEDKEEAVVEKVEVAAQPMNIPPTVHSPSAASTGSPLETYRHAHDSQPPTCSLFIQMELCGYSLRHWLGHERPEDPRVALSIFRQLADALSHLHKHDVIHRDVKPSNVFLSCPPEEDSSLHSEGHLPHSHSAGSVFSEESSRWQTPYTVKLGDFGLAKQLGDEEEEEEEEEEEVIVETSLAPPSPHRPMSCTSSDRHTGGLGTPAYSSPEQLSGQPYSSSTDMFSLGVVLFEMLLPSVDPEMRLRSVRALRAQNIPADFSVQYPEVSLLIAQLCSRDPASRPSADEVLRHPLVVAVSPGARPSFHDQLVQLEKKVELQEMQLREKDSVISALMKELERIKRGS